MSTLLKNLITAFLITLILGGVYFFLMKGSEDEFYSDLSAGNSLDIDVAQRTEKILADTQKINEYQLDVSIFTDARFRSLKDFRVQFNDVETGRENPFEPVR